MYKDLGNYVELFHIFYTSQNSATTQQRIFWKTFSAKIVKTDHQLVFKIFVQFERDR